MTSPDDRFDFDRYEHDLTLPDADVVDLDTARANRTRPAPRPQDIRTDDGDDSDDPEDFESFEVTEPPLGRPVDPPDEITPGFALREAARRPLVAQWLRSWRGVRSMLRWWTKQTAYVTAYHALRVPKYVAKMLWWAPVGLFRGIGRMLKWATAEEGNYTLRQAAADRKDAETWLKLDKQRQAAARWRWMLVFGGATAASIAGAVLAYGPTPSWWNWAIAVGSVPVLARLGRPADKPITDRVIEGNKYRKLTAELVRRALVSLQLSGINSAVAKNPKAIAFPTDIHRDGPGHLAIIDLPYGVEASDVIARRGRLASGLRLPLDQVWPEQAPGHTGRLALWVGYEPASQMKQPAWPLISGGKVDVFKPFPFATTPRLDTVDAELMFRNWLFGGQPGSGKTFALRDLVLAAALDPRVELRGYELKGVGDFAKVAPVCLEYGNGFDDDTIGRAAAFVDWLYEECQRRSKRIDHYGKAGKAPENKVTPELASLKGSGLHPLVAFFDEVQELFSHPTFGKPAGEKMEKVIKLGRALGIIILLGTQIPDKDSLPTGITRNVNTRFCLSVADQTANDMILGTSAYKNGLRATVFEPVVEAGWGILSGLGKPGAKRSYYVDNVAAERIISRAIGYRQKAGTMPTEEEQTRPTGPTFDLLADLLAVWPEGDAKAWNDTLTTRLAEMRPEIYEGWASEQLTAALKPHPGIKVTDVGKRVEGKAVTRRGIARSDVHDVMTERDRKRGAA
ncbi:cell division protein FtsK [Longispora fulva]|uniref:S-DNA-T family DNA segregation ATPase FtsK/SpoIIIE n=1 Tax=Longispora fulva TaxID=619741 RepID=A0A8J7KIA6_9ACTN|nr:FtsK/SpoIIIE domain-containing protein [Longispora fulva]MBG6139380.1 S-DNA-T family DNA segregation ATPase FtsK/SpoIIIE [Longispora fulva]GIG58877.1 cell division protein FtsK [Longispora fulva]